MYSESPLSVQRTSTYHYKVQYQDRVMPAPSQPGRNSKKKKTIFHHPNFGTMERILCAATIYSCWFFFFAWGKEVENLSPSSFPFRNARLVVCTYIQYIQITYKIHTCTITYMTTTQRVVESVQCHMYIYIYYH